jgi:aromatic-L-amino-acid decarboxylase
MDPAEFRTHGYQLVDWIAGYLDDPSRYPVLSRVRPGDITAALPAEAPERGEPFEALFADFERVILPGITHWNHPGFFAYFAITGSAPGVLAEFLSAALNQQAMLWRTSPAATELEAVTLGWLRELMGLDAGFEGVIYDTASISTLHALAAARERVVPGVRTAGLAGRSDLPRFRVYCSEHTHSSIDKAVILLGLGHESLRKIPGDAEFAMRAELLAEAVAEDRAGGWQPLAVVATVGTTSSTSVDPVPLIADLCRREGIWLHVDAAYAGVAAIVPEYRHVLDGADRADSLVVNPHKWLFTPFDLSVLYVRDLPLLRQAFSLVAEYLRTSDAPGVANLMDTGIQLGRRFRALKLWWVLRHFGAEGLRHHLSEHMRLARLFADWVDADPAFERLAPVPFSVVCFRLHPEGRDWTEDALAGFNQEAMDRINAGGEIYLSHTKLGDRFSLRLAIGHLKTTERHVRRAFELLRDAASAR